MKGYNPKESKTSDLNIFNMATGTTKNFGNILEYSVNKKGTGWHI
ncbi:MAG: hypothetical protein R2727_04295 [Bacteroidales bacterium]